MYRSGTPVKLLSEGSEFNCKVERLKIPDAFTLESHYSGLLEHPQYTRPFEWHGEKVPEVLISGHHANIQKWQREQSLRRTLERRPDMLKKAELTKKDKEYLDKIKNSEE